MFTTNFVIIKIISGIGSIFLSKSEPFFIKIGLKYKIFVIIEISEWRKRAIPDVGPRIENHLPVLHFKVWLT